MKTLIELFETSVEKFPNNPYMWEKFDGKYQSFSYQQIHDEVIAFGAGLMAMGINKGDRIALQAEGRTDWIVAELGMLYAGAINVPLSVKLEAGNDVSFRVKHSGARMIIVSWTQADKVESIFDKCDELEKIIYFDEIKEPADHRLSFQSIKDQGRQYLNNPKNKEAFEAIWKNIQPDDLANISYTSGTTADPKNKEAFEAIWKNIQPDDLANISYTSGTTADPKGIMLSHENFTVNTIQGNTLMKIDSTFKTLTILPWDHSFAHTACLYCFMYNGASVACQEIGKTPIETLKNIPKNIKEIEPDLMMSVPAISKSFRKNIEGGIRAKGSTAEKLFNQGLKVAYKYNGNGFNRGKGFRALLKPAYAFYDKLIFSKIRENFGSNLKFFIGGGALLDTELQRFFAAIGIPVMQGYGLSEASPVISSNALHAYKFGSSGRLVKYLDLKICDEDGNEIPSDQKGEMVIKGGNVMKGYWKNEEATKETIKDGWLYTGDMGYLDKDGFLVVLGRFKSLLISSDGEKYSPEGIEESMVDQSPYIDQAMLYNNQSPYTSAMIVPNIPTINRYLDRNGIKPGSDAGNRTTIELIQNEINEYRKGGKYEGMFTERWLPTTFVILPESFNEQNKLLNSTLKMVRGKITEYFAKELDFLYTPEAKNIYNEMNLSAVVKWNTKNS